MLRMQMKPKPNLNGIWIRIRIQSQVPIPSRDEAEKAAKCERGREGGKKWKLLIWFAAF